LGEGVQRDLRGGGGWQGQMWTGAYLMKRATGPGEPVKPAPDDGPIQLTLGGKILIEQR